MTKMDWDSGEGGSGLVPDTVSVIAGVGLTGGGALSSDVTLDVGAGDGIEVSADAVAIKLASPSGLDLTLGDLQIDDTIAGSGLAIGSKILSVAVGNGVQLVSDAVTLKLQTTSGLVVTSSGLAVGEGNGITVDTSSIAINLASPSGLSVSASGLELNDTIAGNGLTISAKVLAVGAGNGLTVSADAIALTTPGTLSVSSSNNASGNHTHAITTSNSPGATSAILASSSAGKITLPSIDISTLLQTNYIGSYGSSSLYLQPTGDIWLNPGGDDVFPGSAYTVNLGALDNKFLTLYAAELWVETLVAQDTVATIGGRIIVAPTTQLVANLGSGDTTIHVKHNQMASGDIAYMEANGSVEYISIDSAPGGSAGDYTYTITRDLDGSGANNWYKGDAVVNTGTTGNGFIDIYSLSGVLSGSGSAIVGRLRTGTTYNNIVESWAIGDLNGLYGYATQTFGVGLGRYEDGYSFITVDDTYGYRVHNLSGVVDTTLGRWANDGQITIGRYASGYGNVNITTSGDLKVRQYSTTRIYLSAAGVLTINDSSGNAVFTFDASAGAQFTLPLTLATTGGIYQGSGSFSSPTTGLKIYNSGGYGRIAGYNAGTVQWYGDTDGKLYAGAGDVILDANGITLTFGSTAADPSTIKFVDSSGNRGSGLYAWKDTLHSWIEGDYIVSGVESGLGAFAWYSAQASSTKGAWMIIRAVGGGGLAGVDLSVDTSDVGTVDIYGDTIYLKAGTVLGSSSTIVPTSESFVVDGGGIHIGGTYPTYTYANDMVIEGGISVGYMTNPAAGWIYYSGRLNSYQGGTVYDVYGFHPLTVYLTSTSWDGDLFSTTGASNIQLDLSSVFGAPAGIKAVLLGYSVKDTNYSDTYDSFIAFTSGSSYTQYVAVRAQSSTSKYVSGSLVVPCDSNGDIWYKVQVASGTTLSVYLQVMGYWI